MECIILIYFVLFENKIKVMIIDRSIIKMLMRFCVRLFIVLVIDR